MVYVRQSGSVYSIFFPTVFPTVDQKSRARERSSLISEATPTKVPVSKKAVPIVSVGDNINSHAPQSAKKGDQGPRGPAGQLILEWPPSAEMLLARGLSHRAPMQRPIEDVTADKVPSFHPLGYDGPRSWDHSVHCVFSTEMPKDIGRLYHFGQQLRAVLSTENDFSILNLFLVDLTSLYRIDEDVGTSNRNPFHVVFLDGLWNCLCRYALEHPEARFLLDCGGFWCGDVGGLQNWGVETLLELLPAPSVLSEGQRATPAPSAAEGQRGTWSRSGTGSPPSSSGKKNSADHDAVGPQEDPRTALLKAAFDLKLLPRLNVEVDRERRWWRPCWYPPFQYARGVGHVSETRVWHKLFARRVAGSSGDRSSNILEDSTSAVLTRTGGDNDARPYMLLVQRRTTRQLRHVAELSQPLDEATSAMDAMHHLEGVLQKRFPHIPVRVADFDALTVAEQINLVANANLLFAVLGAALTNLIWLPPNSIVVEIPLRNGWCCEGRAYNTLAKNAEAGVEQPQCYGMRGDGSIPDAAGVLGSHSSSSSVGTLQPSDARGRAFGVFREAERGEQGAGVVNVTNRPPPDPPGGENYCSTYKHAHYFILSKLVGHRYYFYDPEWVSPVMGVLTPGVEGPASATDWNPIHVGSVYVDFEDVADRLAGLWESKNSDSGGDVGGGRLSAGSGSGSMTEWDLRERSKAKAPAIGT